VAVTLTVLPPAGPTGPSSPAAEWATYRHPSGAWSLRYPGDLLQIDPAADPADPLTILISRDRGTFVAVDLFSAPPGYRGNTGEGLRNRARETLARIYGRPVEERGIVERPAAPWQTGVQFSTALGSQGEAVYQQGALRAGDNRVAGLLYGCKSAVAAQQLPLLQASRRSFSLAPAGG
jgi:hypothetical protein